MVEQQKNHDVKPSWLELPEEEKVKWTYWTVWGRDTNRLSAFIRGLFIAHDPHGLGLRTVYHSKEEAEADAVNPSDHWRWNGQPATPTTLAEIMFIARQGGDRGVKCLGFKDGRWQILKIWPAGEPLIGESE